MITLYALILTISTPDGPVNAVMARGNDERVLVSHIPGLIAAGVKPGRWWVRDIRNGQEVVACPERRG